MPKIVLLNIPHKHAKIVFRLTQNSKDKCVGKVSVQRQFDQVASDTKSTSGLDQRHENPPTDGSIEHSQWDASY